MARLTDRKWKANLLNYEWIAQQEGSACYCLSAKTAQMLLTISNTLGWATRWLDNEFFTDEQKEQIFNWANDCEAELMNSCCLAAGQTQRFRINDDGRVEVSEDEGATWTINDNFDPRVTGTVYQPIDVGDADTNDCQAAANVVANLTELINDDIVGILGEVAGIAAISAAAAPFIAAWFGVPVAGQGVAVAALIAAAVGASAASGAGSISDAFDASYYAFVNCWYYENIGNDTADWSDVDAMIDAISAAFPGGGENFVRTSVSWGILKALGPVGLSNMARLGLAAADCEVCDLNSCYYTNMEVEHDTNWINVTTFGRGGYNPGVGWSGTTGIGPDERITIEYTLPAAGLITELYMGANSNGTVRFLIDGEVVAEVAGAGFGAPYYTYPNVFGTVVTLDLQSPSGTLTISEATIRLSGVSIDFGVYNCE